MPLSWNEIKHRAIAFSKEWKGETREDAEAKSFWDAFFNVFGIQRRTVASFEEPVKSCPAIGPTLIFSGRARCSRSTRARAKTWAKRTRKAWNTSAPSPVADG
jgi:hypothetical protein